MAKRPKYKYEVVVRERNSTQIEIIEECTNWRTACDHAENWNVSHGYGRFDSRDFGTGDRYAEMKEVEVIV